MKVSVEAHDLTWICDQDDGFDLCAHGGFVLRRGSETLLDAQRETFALSAAAVYLLRTVEEDRLPNRDYDNSLVPCCAAGPYVGSDGRFASIGCPNGLEFSVQHVGGSVQLGVNDRKTTVRDTEWAQAVLQFSETVRAFYDASKPRRPDKADAEGWTAFMKEWDIRMESARALARG